MRIRVLLHAYYLKHQSPELASLSCHNLTSSSAVTISWLSAFQMQAQIFFFDDLAASAAARPAAAVLSSLVSAATGAAF